MVYLLLGKEEFSKRQHLNILKAEHLTAGTGGFNYDEFNAADDDINRIIDCAKTLPFMGKQRFVVINGVDKISRLDLKKKEILVSFIETRPKYVVIVLTADLLDASSDILRAVRKYGAIEDCHPLNGEGLGRWITGRFSDFKKRAHPEAIKALWETTGNNLGLLNQAIETLAVYTGASAVVYAKDVQGLVGNSVQTTAFQLADAIGAKDSPNALKIIEGLNKDAGFIPKVLGALGSHLRKIWRVKKLIKCGIPLEKAVQTAGVWYNKNNFSRQVKNFSAEELEKYFKALLRLDKEAKTSSSQACRSLEVFVMRVCGAASS